MSIVAWRLENPLNTNCSQGSTAYVVQVPSYDDIQSPVRRVFEALGHILRSGDHVVVKPNLITSSHPKRMGEWEQVITHPCLLSAIIDCVYSRIGINGRITIADGPQTDSDFSEIVARTKLDELVADYQRRGCAIELLDLRRDRWIQKEGITHKRLSLAGDPRGYTTVELGQQSEFVHHHLSGRLYGADYDINETAMFHHSGRHAYVLCRTVMDADVIINVPKMKTHKKTGVTLSLKNMVGVNGLRNCLPHHTLGTPAEGGDEFSENTAANRIQSRGIRSLKTLITRRGRTGGLATRMAFQLGRMLFGSTEKVVRSGNWYGNDTTWRMVLDLNKCIFNFDGTARRRSVPLRYMTIVDGVIAGEGDGPVYVDAKNCGVLVAGINPLCVDTVAAIIMGFDDRKLKMLAGGWQARELPLAGFHESDVRVISDVAEWNGSIASLRQAPHLGFRPHFGWIGHIEREVTSHTQ